MRRADGARVAKRRVTTGIASASISRRPAVRLAIALGSAWIIASCTVAPRATSEAGVGPATASSNSPRAASATATALAMDGPAASEESARPATATVGLAPHEVGAWDPGWDGWDVAVAGRYAYVAGGQDGLSVVDFADASDPREVGAWSAPGPGGPELWDQVEAAGTSVFVARQGEVVSIDVTDPAAPVALDALTLDAVETAPWVTALGDSWLYVANERALQVVDVRDPAHLLPVAAKAPPSFRFDDTVWDLAVDGATLFAAVGASGVQVVDVADRTEPRTIGRYRAGWEASALEVDDGFAYVLGRDDDSSIHLLDVSAREHPVEVSRYGAAGPDDPFAERAGVIAFDVDGDRLVVVAQSGDRTTLELLDAHDPTRPERVAVSPAADWGPELPLVPRLAGDHVVVAANHEGLRLYEVGAGARIEETGAIDTPGGAFDVDVVDGVAYVAAWRDGLRVVDVADPARARELGAYLPVGESGAEGSDGRASPWVTGVDVADGYAFVAAGQDGLRVVDVRDAAAPKEVARYVPKASDAEGSPAYVSGVSVRLPYAYISSAAADLTVLDVGTPSDPRPVGECVGSASGGAVWLDGGRAYVAAGWSGLRIIDVADPAQPRQIGAYEPAVLGTIPDPSHIRAALDVAVAGEVAYVAFGDDGVHIVDVHDPASPWLLARYRPTREDGDDTSVNGLALAGRRLLVGVNYAAVQVLDVSDPSRPTRTADVPLPGVTQRVHVVGDRAYVANSYGGLRILDLGPALAGGA